MECARRAGCTPIVVLTGDGGSTAAGLDATVRRCADLAAAAEAIITAR
jgi:phosphoglycolate phosphatase-like HAD superfamily hydrolase